MFWPWVRRATRSHLPSQVLRRTNPPILFFAFLLMIPFPAGHAHLTRTHESFLKGRKNLCRCQKHRSQIDRNEPSCIGPIRSDIDRPLKSFGAKEHSKERPPPPTTAVRYGAIAQTHFKPKFHVRSKAQCVTLTSTVW